MAQLFPTPLKPPRAQFTLLPPGRRSHRWRWVAGVIFILFVLAVVAIRIVVMRAEPILRTRVVETLSNRFRSRVELAELHVWVVNGVHVDGKGLKIYGATDPNPWEAGVQPLLEIGEFRFQSTVASLFREPMHVDTIFVNALSMNIPPKADRQQMSNLRRRSGKMSIVVDHFVCKDTKLVINTAKPGKAPLEFDISDLVMNEIGPDQPLRFEATLVNPKPVGDIHSTGTFGPLNDSSPRDSAVAGDYSFTNADLGTLKGIGGTLSSTGRYSGTLGRIEVDGATDTPDFRLTISGHRVPLHTDFHAIVDGTDGDTYLQPVNARVLSSSFTAKGKIVRVKDPAGHDIELNVVLGKASIEDLLTLGVKTDPPIMTGAVKMKTALSLPPGKDDVAGRLRLKGNFQIPRGLFTNEKIQTRINSLSLRSRGEPKRARDAADVTVASDLQGKFTLEKGVLSIPFLHFQVPGTHADAMGQYSLDGNTFDFHGTLKLDAKLSQMTTGWKSILLKPVDPFFRKNGAGAEVPFKITGTRTEPHFGLDFSHDREDASKGHGDTPLRQR